MLKRDTVEMRIESARRSRATVLDLSDYQLAVLPESLGQLTQLQSLHLSDNQLTVLPDWLGQLSELRTLNLSNNQLAVLPEWLGHLSQLQMLNLASNRLTVLPEWPGQLSLLQSLDLANNQMTVLPEWVGQLTQLQSLFLSTNRLIALPESLCELTQLQSLFLSDNQFAVLPEWLGKLSQLRTLSLSDNQLAVLPESLGQLKQLQSLYLSDNQLTVLPECLGRLTQLQTLELFNNELTTLPQSLCELTQLESLYLSCYQLTALPKWLGKLKQLQILFLPGNPSTELPESLRELRNLRVLYLCGSQLTELPEWLGELNRLESLYLAHTKLTVLPESLCELTQLRVLDLSYNQLTELPDSLGQLSQLQTLNLSRNPLNPELAAASAEGLDAVKRYLLAKAEAQVVLNEAKLILVGEGGVGKSCLLGALRGERWDEGKPTTHGIEIKHVKVTDPNNGTEVTLNGWDFGGQRIYRPTHQLFFSAPAVYLVVWKPREGSQAGAVKEWIKLVKHREPDAKILVVATHGGPKERLPDIDRQEIWDLFGKETVLDFFFVDSKPPSADAKSNLAEGECAGIKELRDAIARVAGSLPEVGRSVPKRWEEARTALLESDAAYLPLDQVLKLCTDRNMGNDEAMDFIRVAHRLGHLIHYAHDPALRDIVVLKPDWLSIAMSYVLDDKQTREAHGLVEFSRLGELWNDPLRPPESRYDANLHPLFLRLMERFDLSYKVAVPAEPENALGFWQRVAGYVGLGQKAPTKLQYTSLIAQLVPDLRPKEEELTAVWPLNAPDGEAQQMQICRIVEANSGQSASAEGLFYQLIVRLHKYSLGRVDYRQSVHWQRGLVLDGDYHGRAFMEHHGNDVRITVRAAYPEAFLAVLSSEVKWLVESFWEGLQCDVMVPCVEPCGKAAPGTGLFEVQKLIESKRDKRPEFPCSVCNKWQDIDALLRNAVAARNDPLEELLAELLTMKAEVSGARAQLVALRGEAMGRFDRLDSGTVRILSQVDDAFQRLMRTLTDEAKEGPRLFSFQPIEPGFFDRPNWVSQKFRLTLWCEHSRLPLPELNGARSKVGVYELNVPRDWFVKAAPFLKVLTGTLSLVLPVAASATKLIMDETAYKGLEKELDLGQKSIESVLKGGETAGVWLGRSDAPELEGGEAILAQGAVLRQLHAWIKEEDPGFGGLVRVLNKRNEFLWVHSKFESEY